jgi:hypothetical protein
MVGAVCLVGASCGTRAGAGGDEARTGVSAPETSAPASAVLETEERRRAVQLYHKQPGISTERAAARITTAMEKGSPRLLIRPDTWVVDKLARLLPARSDVLMGGVARLAVNRQRPDGRKLL